MKLSTALATIKGTSAEKTASETPSASASVTPSSDLGDRLKVALTEALAPEKTASAASPVNDMTKIAADIAASEHEALVKEAQIYGSALCDGFMARAAQYNEAAQKVAAANPSPTMKTSGDESFDKFAAENPGLVSDAARVGYDATMNQVASLKQAAYDAGWNNAVEQAYKTASEYFVYGFKTIHEMIEASR